MTTFASQNITRKEDEKDRIAFRHTLDETERICKKYGFSPDIAIECNDPRLTSAILNIQPYTMLLTSPGLQHRVLNPDIYTDTIVSFCEPVSSSLYVIRRKKHHFSSVAEKFYQYICEEIKNDCVQSESLLSDYFAVNSKPNPPQQAADMT